MTRRGIVATLAAAVLSVTATVAQAADSATLNVIGYSPDFQYFAFEQLGVQDGSGFPYSEIFVVDLERNQWVKGSPVRQMIEDEQATPGKAHASAMDAARKLLEALDISEPAQLLADLPATQVGSGRMAVAFDQWYNSIAGPAAPQAEAMPSRMVLSIKEVDLPTPAACSTYDEPVKGFVLSIKRPSYAGPDDIIHEDRSIPASRGCPVAYDIAAVASPVTESERSRLVAFVAVYARGFEGLNRRYIAIPFK